MIEEFKNILNEMDLKLTKYSQRRDYEQKLSILKEESENDTNMINELTYEIDSLKFSIRNGELIPIFSSDKWCYPDINKFDNTAKIMLSRDSMMHQIPF